MDLTFVSVEKDVCLFRSQQVYTVPPESTLRIRGNYTTGEDQRPVTGKPQDVRYKGGVGLSGIKTSGVLFAQTTWFEVEFINKTEEPVEVWDFRIYGDAYHKEKKGEHKQ
jgi:hypothetical protein